MTIQFRTKPEICRYMVELLPPGVLSVLELRYGDMAMTEALVQYGYSATIQTEETFWSLDEGFDAVVMNPPFTPMKRGYKILFRCMELAPVVIALMPWLTIINSVGRAEAFQDFGLKSVTHLPRTAFPGARVQTCILNLVRGHMDVTKLYFYREEVRDADTLATG